MEVMTAKALQGPFPIVVTTNLDSVERAKAHFNYVSPLAYENSFSLRKIKDGQHDAYLIPFNRGLVYKGLLKEAEQSMFELLSFDELVELAAAYPWLFLEDRIIGISDKDIIVTERNEGGMCIETIDQTPPEAFLAVFMKR